MSTRVDLADFGPAPLDDWTCYPGRRPASSFVFCGDHLRVGHPLDVDGELSLLGASPLLERTAVLAYGSNACPMQLARKYEGFDGTTVIPLTRGWAHDLAVVYSDHESRYGAVPATIMPSTGSRSEVFIAWLDREQLTAFDRSEGLNYERRSFDVRRHALRVVDGPRPVAVDVYVSTRGVFASDGVVPGVHGIDTTYRAGPLLTQAELQRLRAGVPAPLSRSSTTTHATTG
jgi:hypothetical protein